MGLGLFQFHPLIFARHQCQPDSTVPFNGHGGILRVNQDVSVYADDTPLTVILLYGAILSDGSLNVPVNGRNGYPIADLQSPFLPRTVGNGIPVVLAYLLVLTLLFRFLFLADLLEQSLDGVPGHFFSSQMYLGSRRGDTVKLSFPVGQDCAAVRQPTVDAVIIFFISL